jgi:MFS family permease
VFVQTLTLIPVFARDVLAVGAEGLGLLHAASAVGAMVGGAILGLLGGVARPIPVMLTAFAARGLWLLVFGQSPAFELALLALFCAGVADVVSEVTSQTVVQLKTPDAVRGRVMAFGMLFTWNGPQLGQLQSGVTASLLGPRTAALVGGLGGMLVPLLFSRFPAMRRGMREIKGR